MPCFNITISKQRDIFAAGVNSELSTYITIHCVFRRTG